eukprot:13637887-Alexandrium_andersonii.AAC.1
MLGLASLVAKGLVGAGIHPPHEMRPLASAHALVEHPPHRMPHSFPTPWSHRLATGRSIAR